MQSELHDHFELPSAPGRNSKLSYCGLIRVDSIGESPCPLKASALRLPGFSGPGQVSTNLHGVLTWGSKGVSQAAGTLQHVALTGCP